MATAIHFGRPLFVVFGDFLQVFLQTWREVFLALLKRNAGIQGGALLLLHEMLDEDIV